MKLKNRKGLTLSQFGGLALAFVVVSIILSMGGEILTQISDTQTALSAGKNITAKGLEGVIVFGDWLPTIAVVVAAAVVIGIIVHYFRSA